MANNRKVIWHPKLLTKIYSEVLGEEVILAGNGVLDEDIEEKFGEDLVCYREFECIMLAKSKLSREELVLINEMKKGFKYSYVENIK